MLWNILEWYNYAVDDLADKRTEHFPLIRSPIPIVIISIVYLIFVLKWGPEFMKNRQPYNLKNILIVYNIIQMTICTIGVIIGINYVNFSLWYCNPVLPAHMESPMLLYLGYLYFSLKLLDLMDTVFFILKKNYRQVTVLHVTHHSMVLVSCWWCFKYIPSGHSVYMPVLNTIAHSVMYGYYLLTAYDPKYKKNIWMKKQITHIQFIQFFLGLIIYVVPIFNGCDSNPKALFYLTTFVNVFMIIMFSNFYYQTYIKKNA